MKLDDLGIIGNCIKHKQHNVLNKLKNIHDKNWESLLQNKSSKFPIVNLPVNSGSRHIVNLSEYVLLEAPVLFLSKELGQNMLSLHLLIEYVPNLTLLALLVQ